ncbi:HalOD1 output domain-containing protein [Halorarum halobium]|uniref:HalOD1 output domain-containing protein n=1 Tax=Halorarum halobium TaxID=3075121 RepID=UPI0028B0115A|nr:HalOD1 output domain-containing protein [Halobaculum sp. XH14]
MEPPEEKSMTVEITKSMSVVEFDADQDSFRAAYDSTQDLTSLAVVEVVASALGREPWDLTPLQSAIDTDALDELATESATDRGNCDSISFSYEDFEVTVRSEGVIEAAPIENS